MNRKKKYRKAQVKAAIKREGKAEEDDKKLRHRSMIQTRKAKRMINIEQYAKDNNVTLAQAMIHFMD